MKHLFRAGAAVMLCLPLAAQANMTLDLNQSKTPLANASITQNAGWSWQNVGAGTLNGTLDGKSFSTYCVELNQPLSWSAQKYSLASFSPADGDMLNRLYTVANHKVTDLTSGLAFQLAVWEIVNEAKDNFQVKYAPGASGQFGAANLSSTHQSAYQSANQWLAEAKSLDASKITWSTQKLTNGNYQDYVLAAQVPEPETYAMMLAGLGLMAAITRRRNKNAGKKSGIILS
ncbi:PEP-CTERM sorting domain-containing protein [Craterilacuibacter sp. RT1T]|uniref:PEP-CTERM sorting domain-containing protein n=1 Tax=Craterilacuibacter sp. RT1T TaxID=2942211 RepID=UPI0020C00B4B|nr:PEP-CTERM sorting domain-containing protein [Craterilacuibacter sp. RT1T]MCL6263349.1 PEP-CTERM sorting domain-containing protein [Craterilacuibacter sp. RT1T]